MHNNHRKMRLEKNGIRSYVMEYSVSNFFNRHVTYVPWFLVQVENLEKVGNLI